MIYSVDSAILRLNNRCLVCRCLAIKRKYSERKFKSENETQKCGCFKERWCLRRFFFFGICCLSAVVSEIILWPVRTLAQFRMGAVRVKWYGQKNAYDPARKACWSMRVRFVRKIQKHNHHVIKYLLTEFVRAVRDNIWLSVRSQPNIFQSGSPTQSINT